MTKLEQAIQEKNIASVRNILKSYLSSDPSDSDSVIEQSLKQIKTARLDVWEPHDLATLETDKSEWDEDYFINLHVDLRMNFSEERYKHMLKVGRRLYSSSLKESSSTSSIRPVMTPSSSSVDGVKKNNALLWGAVAVGAVIIVSVIIKVVNSNN